jgi:hypothetical protein
MIPLIGFSPDAEPTTPGCILDASNIIPYEAGMKAAPSAAAVALGALATECKGSAVVRQLSGGSRFFAATASNLYEASGASWSSVGSAYALGTDDRWSFAGYGDAVLASNPSTKIQRSVGGAFSVIASAPKAKILVSVKGFVLAFATNEATYGDSPDRWWCSALYNETDWTPSLSTQCTNGRLTDGSGGFTAAVRFGDQVVAYKNRSMHLGHYAGTPSVWDWAVVSFDVGCIGPDAAADTSIGHIFVGSDNIYHFDGTRPVSIATGVVRQWWIDNSSAEFRYRTKLLWDRDNSLVWMFFPSSGSSGTCDDCLVFHVSTQQWGRVGLAVEAVVNYVSPSITYDGGSSLITTYDSSPAIAFDSPFWLSQKGNPAIFSATHTIKTLTGIPGAWWFETGDYGDETQWSYCSDLRLRFAQKPASTTCTSKTKETSGDVLTTAATVSHDGSKFPLRQTARFHRFRVDGSGAAKFSAIQPTTIDAGSR